MARIRYAIHCIKHGKEGKDWAGKQVLVAQAKNKKQRFYGGCPECNAAEANALKEAAEAAKGVK